MFSRKHITSAFDAEYQRAAAAIDHMLVKGKEFEEARNAAYRLVDAADRIAKVRLGGYEPDPEFSERLQTLRDRIDEDTIPF